MEIVAVVAVAVAAAVVAAIVSHHRAFDRAVAEVAQARGLSLTPGRLLTRAGAHGVVNGITVSVACESDGEEAFTVVRTSGGPPRTLRICAEGRFSKVAKALGSPDLTLGDPGFDDRVILAGLDPKPLRALMGDAARRAVRRAVDAGGTLRDGRWTFSRSGTIADAQQILKLVDLAVAAAAALRPAGSDADRLRRIVETDPVRQIRLEALAALGAEAGADWLARVAAGRDPAVAVVAARMLGPDGRAVLVRHLDHRDRKVARYAALWLLRSEPGPERPAIEAALIRCLADEPDPDVIDALGTIGTAAAVPPLRAAASSGLGLVGTAARARAAIRAIQARLPAVRGGLALADDPRGPGSGALSPADAARRSRLRTRE